MPTLAHVFLIRDPAQCVPSFYTTATVAKDFFFWDINGIGIEESRRLFDYMMKQSGKTPIVIDSDDLVNHPEAVLKYLCDLVKIPFDGRMLDWSHSKKEADDQLAVFMAWRKLSRFHPAHSY